MARAVAWPVAPVVFVLMAADPVIPLEATDVPYAAAILACWAVGVVLTVRAFEQPAGWAFLGLGTALVGSGYTDQLADDHPLVAVFGDSSFVWWFMFLALGLQFTPMNRSTSRLWRALPAVTIGSACLFQLGALFRSQKLEGTDDVSPWAIESIAGLIAAFAAAAILTLAVCLLLSVYALVKAFRRARGEERQQLLGGGGRCHDRALRDRLVRRVLRRARRRGGMDHEHLHRRPRARCRVLRGEVPPLRRRAPRGRVRLLCAVLGCGARRLRSVALVVGPAPFRRPSADRSLADQRRHLRGRGLRTTDVSQARTAVDRASTGGASTPSGGAQRPAQSVASMSRSCCARPSATRAPASCFRLRAADGSRRAGTSRNRPSTRWTSYVTAASAHGSSSTRTGTESHVAEAVGHEAAAEIDNRRPSRRACSAGGADHRVASSPRRGTPGGASTH